MKKSKSFLSFVFFLSVFGFNAQAALAQVNEKATFVLVHGALFTSSGWAQLQDILQERGYNVVTLDIPGRLPGSISPEKVDLHVAAEKVCQVARLQHGKVVLVGHSQGGAVINQALNECGEKIEALAYIAAVFPLSGETAFQSLDPERDTGFGQVATFDVEAQLFRVKKDGPIHEIFFADIDALAAERAIATMVSEPGKIGMTPLTTPNEKLQSVPKYYIEATEDRVISIETQRRLQAKADMKIFSMKASHCPFLSKPAELAKFLQEVERSQ